MNKYKYYKKKVANNFMYIYLLATRNKKNQKFSIVTATYNSEAYLEKYFESIFNNKYDVLNIEVIIVDDGSTDKTKDKVKEWQVKYPKSIVYVYQENQGQAIARNTGIKYAKNKWITFIDSDDFVNEIYFKEVNEAINLTKEKSIISTRWINFYDDTEEYLDKHPLNYRFNGKKKYLVRNMLKDQNSFQLAMNSVFFNRNIIKDNQIKIKDVKPQFEDAVFVFDYMRMNKNYNITFTREALYYYRKRADNTSTLNKAHFDTRRYVELLENGYLYVLNTYYSNFGYIPNFVQNAILYDLSWNIKELEINKVKLNREQQEKREEYLKKIFNLIPFRAIVRNWKYYWKMYQIGLNARYYENQNGKKAGVYYYYTIENSFIIQLISVEDRWTINLDDKAYNLNDLDYRKYEEKVNGEHFVTKYYIKIPKEYKTLSFNYGGYNERVVNFHLKKEGDIMPFSKDSLILFYDRDIRADDNAEVFYDWMKKNKPEFKKIVYAIQNDVPDWKRLENKGFNLIDYGSEEFCEIYLKADYIISSGFDRKIENYKNLRYQQHRTKGKFIFLQHGIITDDLSEWFSSKRVDKMVTSTNFEYKNLSTKYNLFKEQVMLTGLPRYDKLYNDVKNEILFQPTWRMQYQNYSTEQIKETEYIKNIKKILKDKKLKEKLRKEKYKLKFIPHPEMNKHIELFKECENDVIQVLNLQNIVFRDEFAKAKLMITDYSSVFTDFGYLRKPIIYYQYDIEEFYQGHLYDPELKYEDDGLGSVQKSYKDLLEKIFFYFDNNFKVEDMYQERINNFFKYNDQNNCQRLFDELTKKDDI